jgi:hypothetical protein
MEGHIARKRWFTADFDRSSRLVSTENKRQAAPNQPPDAAVPTDPALGNGSEDNTSFYGSSVSGGAWHRIELYMLLSDVDVRNGERYYMMDYSAGATHSTLPGGHFSDPWGEGLDPNLYEGAAIATLTSASEGSLLNNAVLPFFTRPDQLTQIWVDEVYLDSTQARVELGEGIGNISRVPSLFEAHPGA